MSDMETTTNREGNMFDAYTIRELNEMLSRTPRNSPAFIILTKAIAEKRATAA